MTQMRASTLMLLLSVLAWAGCSTPKGRIEKSQAIFDQYPADVQDAIRAGEVRVTFTMEQVRMALGEADRVYRVTTAKGEQETWAYAESKPSIGFGFGLGGGGGSTRVGTGIGVSTGGGADEKLRVVFENGRVVAVETLN